MHTHAMVHGHEHAHTHTHTENPQDNHTHPDNPHTHREPTGHTHTHRTHMYGGILPRTVGSLIGVACTHIHTHTHFIRHVITDIQGYQYHRNVYN